MRIIIDRIDDKSVIYETDNETPPPDGIHVKAGEYVVSFEFIKYGMNFYNARKEYLESLEEEEDE